jgi:UDP-2-acetamido-3-amino-2,3-dideoxy-glucuronate N-acetyltransferase
MPYLCSFADLATFIYHGCFLSNIGTVCHVMTGARIGKKCTLGQNVVISPDVILGDNVKVQNRDCLP